MITGMKVQTMKENNRLFLLDELREIERLIINRRKKIPFVKIFRLHKEKRSNKYIAKKLKIDMFKVNSVIHGAITIPKSKIKEVENLGFKICSCCKKRIVPINSLEYVKLTRLCKICYKRGSEIEYSLPNLNNK